MCVFFLPQSRTSCCRDKQIISNRDMVKLHMRIWDLYEEPSRNTAMDVGTVDQASPTSHPYGIQSSAKSTLQPGITQAKFHLRSCSTGGLLTRDVAEAMLWLLEFSHQQSEFTEWRESCLNRPGFYLKSFIFSYCYSHFSFILHLPRARQKAMQTLPHK